MIREGRSARLTGFKLLPLSLTRGRQLFYPLQFYLEPPLNCSNNSARWASTGTHLVVSPGRRHVARIPPGLGLLRFVGVGDVFGQSLLGADVQVANLLAATGWAGGASPGSWQAGCRPTTGGKRGTWRLFSTLRCGYRNCACASFRFSTLL